MRAGLAARGAPPSLRPAGRPAGAAAGLQHKELGGRSRARTHITYNTLQNLKYDFFEVQTSCLGKGRKAEEKIRQKEKTKHCEISINVL